MGGLGSEGLDRPPGSDPGPGLSSGQSGGESRRHRPGGTKKKKKKHKVGGIDQETDIYSRSTSSRAEETAHGGSTLNLAPFFMGSLQIYCLGWVCPMGISLAMCRPSQSDFGQLYKVKCENMKNLDCPSFPMVCGPMF